MCGIAGILELDSRQSQDASLACERSLDRMLDSIFHRGPDDSGKLVDGELAMGMRRLSIIDLVDGQQPIFDESGRFAIVFNGEIYNYKELRSELIKKGHQFKTQSDTEVIVHLFEDYGSKCVEFLRGMFAFAVWDRRHRSLFIARDRLGIKPLYFWSDDDKLVFGSEIKSLLQVAEVPRELDRTALSQYLSLKYVPAPRTLFQNIRCLLPGHSLEVRDGRVVTRQYWDIPFSDAEDHRSENDLVDELDEVLGEAVRLRLRSDVPFGAFLSGGIDSSLIVAMMAKHLEQPVQTFSVGFGGHTTGEEDELPYAKMVGDRFGCQQHTFRITSKHFLDHAEDVLWHMDQPIADQATVATHMVSALARKHVKMVLTGEGGDELFAGYARYRGERLSRYSALLPGILAPAARRCVASLPGLRRAKIAFNALSQRDEATRFANWFPMFSDDAKACLLKHWTSDTEGAASVFRNHLDRCDSKRALSRMLYCDSKSWLVDYLLLRGDKLTMANSLEARVPLLDHHVVEFASGLPDSMKLNGGQSKYLLKKLASRYLPEEIINRPKKGFPIPIDRWLRNEARELVRDTLSAESLRSRGLFDADFVESLVAKHESGYADLSTEVWGLVSVEMWMRRFLDQPQSRSEQTPSVSNAV